MKVILSAATLAQGLAPAVRAAQGAQSAAGVLIRAEKGGLTLVGTDGTTAVRTFVPVSARQEDGTVLVSAQRLYRLVRALQPDDVTLEVTGPLLSVRGGDFSGRLMLMPVGNFPDLKDVTGVLTTFSAKDFSRAAFQVLPAVSQDSGRQHMQGVLVRLSGDKMTLAATDGVRVAESSIKVYGNGYGAFVLPPAVVAEAARAGVDSVVHEAPVLPVALSRKGFKIMTTPLDVDFPDYKKFMAKKFAHAYVADKASLLAAIGRVNLLADDMTALEVSVEDGRLTALVNVPGIGGAVEHTKLDVKVGGGTRFATAFKPRLLYAGLENASGDSIEMFANEPLRPVMFTDGNGYRYLLMPMRVAKKND